MQQIHNAITLFIAYVVSSYVHVYYYLNNAD